jgi:hypothetical protein
MQVAHGKKKKKKKKNREVYILSFLNTKKIGCRGECLDRGERE